MRLRTLIVGLAAATSLLIAAAPAAAQSVQLVPFGGQTFSQPYYVTGAPGDPSRVFVDEAGGTIRLVKAAIEYALRHKRRNVTLVHKGNIMKYTEGAFRDWGYSAAERIFGDKVYTWARYDRTKKEKGEPVAQEEQKAAVKNGALLVKDAIADITLQQVLTRPEDFDVIATLNLNGDYLSDALAAQVGGIGIAPGGNINYVTGHAIFEATHGTAPKYANQDRVNPGSVVLSGEMMLRYMGWGEAADLILKGLNGAIASKRVTYDFARLMEGATEIKCSEFGTNIIQNM